MIISRTPFRISFFGGGTDYPAWYREEPGAVLSTSIDKYCYLNCRALPPFFDYTIRVVYTHTELVSSLDRIKHPAVRECLRYMSIPSGIEVHHAADLPARSGLGASSSFIVGLLHALHVMKGANPSGEELAREAIRIEQDSIGEIVGSQDQTAAAIGGLNRIAFGGEKEISVEAVSVEPERIAALESHLLLFFTGIFRNAPEIAADQVLHMREHREGLREMRAMVDEGVSILTDHGSLDEFGRLLHEAWRIKRTLSERVSNPTIDAIYAAAREAGAIGGKLLGAGGGGFMLFHVPPDRHHAVRERLKGLVKVPFRFESGGSQIIFRNRG
jgi:D-glycero-alpha-D-manno-heptose-7-phosphate kinase